MVLFPIWMYMHLNMMLTKVSVQRFILFYQAFSLFVKIVFLLRMVLLFVWKSISSKSWISVCRMDVEDYFTPIEGEFEYPKLINHLTSVSKYQNGTSDSHQYINKIVPIEQVKEVYIDLIKDIQAFITSLKCRKQ